MLPIYAATEREIRTAYRNRLHGPQLEASWRLVPESGSSPPAGVYSKEVIKLQRAKAGSEGDAPDVTTPHHMRRSVFIGKFTPNTI
jgi:hypothetical protein